MGILVDGLPLGFLLPGGLAAFMRVPEDSADHFLVASMLTLLRWAALVLSLCLPAAFVAISMYHQEMLPVKLLLSMTAAKQYVPFGVATEVIAMLLSFELLQEAGLRLPDPRWADGLHHRRAHRRPVRGGGEGRLARRGHRGRAGGHLRLRHAEPGPGRGGEALRLLFVLAAVLLGFYGLMAALALLILHLGCLESFGAPLHRALHGQARPRRADRAHKAPEPRGQVPLPAPRGPEQKEAEMRRISAVLLLCATFLPLSGCTLSVYNNYRELERLQVIETVGLDAGEDGGVVLSVSSGRDASGRELLRASAEAPSVTEAMQRLQGLSRSDELFFSGTGCILIGEAAAAQTARWLELVARSDSLRLDTPLFIVRGGEAAELVTQAGGEYGDITQIMRALISFAEKSGPARICTCADAARS